MSQTTPGIGRDVLPSRIVKRRIHQDAVNGAGGKAGGSQRRDILHVESISRDPAIKVVQARVLRGELRKYWIDLEQRHPQVRNAGGKRKASGAYAGAEIDRMLATTRSRGGRQQDGVVTEPVATQWLPQTHTRAPNGLPCAFAL